jgi:hypothetical protein
MYNALNDPKRYKRLTDINKESNVEEKIRSEKNRESIDRYDY